MHAIKSHPDSQRYSSADLVESAPPAESPSRADLALVAALVAPPAIVGLLVLIGVGVGVAVCVMFATIFAVTTTLDVRWTMRCRRDGNDLRRARV